MPTLPLNSGFHRSAHDVGGVHASDQLRERGLDQLRDRGKIIRLLGTEREQCSEQREKMAQLHGGRIVGLMAVFKMRLRFHA